MSAPEPRGATVNSHPDTTRFGPGRQAAREVAERRTAFTTWDAKAGAPGPVHVRIDRADGSKTFSWPPGTRTADLVYFAPGPEPPPLDATPRLVVVEGEKTADAVARAGLPAAGLVGGASTLPGPAVVSLLASYHDVVLWADNDDVGRRLMQRLATELERAGLDRCHVVDPPEELADGGDAADLPTERVRELIDGARELVMIPEAHREAGDEPRAAPGALEDDGRHKPTAAERLVAIATKRFSFYRADDGEPYAVAVDGPPVARFFRGGRESLRKLLSADYAEQFGRVPPAQTLVDALAVLEGRALSAPRRQPALRAALLDGRLYLDLADESGRVVEVDADGWRLRPAREVPIVWRRSEATSALPTPTRGGAIDGLLRFANISRDGLAQALAALVTSFLGRPAPILLLRGPAGAAKTSTAKALRLLLDPSPDPVRSIPRDLEDWAVGAAASRIVALDNLEHVATWLADALCRAVTGEGVIRRRLYTDGELSILTFRRAIILTALDPGALRGDLADRVVAIDLDAIPDDRRLEDDEVETGWAAEHPVLLGAALDVLSAVLAYRPHINLDRKPRMADYARTLAAVDTVLGTEGLPLYLRQRGELQREAAEGDRIGSAVLRFLDGREAWEGTAEDLLTALTPDHPPRDWPETPRALSARLRRVAAPLAAAGITVEFRREGHNRARIITLERGSNRPSAPSAPSASSVTAAPGADANALGADANADANGPTGGSNHARADAKDDADAKSLPLSTPLPPSSGPSAPSGPEAERVGGGPSAPSADEDYPPSAWLLDEPPLPEPTFDDLETGEGER